MRATDVRRGMCKLVSVVIKAFGAKIVCTSRPFQPGQTHLWSLITGTCVANGCTNTQEEIMLLKLRSRIWTFT